MIIKSKNLLLFNPDALKVEYVAGLEWSYYIMACKNGQKFYIQGYDSEEKAREVLNNLSENVKKGKPVTEI